MAVEHVSYDTFFFPTVFTFSPQKCLFPQTPSLFPHLSNYCSDKTLTYPSTVGGHILNAAARLKTYPTL